VARLETFPDSILKLLLRLGLAGVFFKSGLTKIASWEFTILLFRDEYKVPVLPPELAAVLATTVELTCPVLLVLGFATRLTTLPLLGMTAVIQLFVFPESWVDHLMWTAMLLVLLTRGPGAISLDRWLAPLVLAPKGR
jgi:putative oxidoreductase